jgi:hypothetical protein
MLDGASLHNSLLSIDFLHPFLIALVLHPISI